MKQKPCFNIDAASYGEGIAQIIEPVLSTVFQKIDEKPIPSVNIKGIDLHIVIENICCRSKLCKLLPFITKSFLARRLPR